MAHTLKVKDEGLRASPSSNIHLAAYLRSWRDLIEDGLRTQVPQSDDPTRLVQSAMHYAIEQGHRWRPLILISTYEACAAKSGLKVIEAACAIELIHSCTIILDDLPCVDNSDLRRGRLACHKVHGEAITIYASHSLYALAEILAGENSKSLGLPEDRVRRHLCRLRSRLIEAQVLELNLARQSIPGDAASLERLYELKASLFTSAAWLGATLAQQEKGVTWRFMEFGKYLGMAYQLADDIGDVTGDSEEMGKPTCADQNKINFVTCFGIKRAKDLLQTYWRTALDCLEHLTCDARPVRDVGSAILNTAQFSPES